MNVLVTSDGSTYSLMAIRTASRLLRAEDRNVDVLCVVPPYRRRDESLRRKRYEQRILSETTRILEEARAAIAPEAAAVKLVTEMGSPAAVIAARSENYDVTVVGRGASGTAWKGDWARWQAGWPSMRWGRF